MICIILIAIRDILGLASTRGSSQIAVGIVGVGRDFASLSHRLGHSLLCVVGERHGLSGIIADAGYHIACISVRDRAPARVQPLNQSATAVKDQLRFVGAS